MVLLCFLLRFITVGQQLLFVHLKGESYRGIAVALRSKLPRSQTKGPFHIHLQGHETTASTQAVYTITSK